MKTKYLAALLLIASCSSKDDNPNGEKTISSRSYKGHEVDNDANNLVNAYPNTVGTRLDDCQTCHKGASFTEVGGKSVFQNACDFCHLITHPDSDLVEAQPTTYIETLNPFGTAYANAGRTQEAFATIAATDSDDDGHTNEQEIKDLKYPGDPNSKPGQSVAPMRIFSKSDLSGRPAHDQFLLANSHKQEYDNYASYKGITIKDLLEAAGVDLSDSALVGITVIAPDGYLKDFTVDEITNAYPAGLFYGGLDNATLGTECGFVTYPDTLPSGLLEGGPIPGEQWLMLAYEHDGLAMQPCVLDLTEGKISGEGPFRLVVPQSTPGSPDRGSRSPKPNCNDSWNHVETKDHNAGSMVRGVIAIRTNPLPAGYEDFDHYNGGWAYIDNESIIVYGHGVIAQ